MKASIGKVAEMAGVSTATVSRVLNNVGQISDSTRSAVMEAVKKADYVPRGAGSRKAKAAPSPNGSGTLELIFCFSLEPERIRFGKGEMEVNRNGIISPEILLADSQRYESSFYRLISEGVIEEARRHGYKTVTHCVDKEKLDNPALIKMLKDDGADGLLLAGEHPSGIAGFLRKCPLPVVLVDIIADEGPVEVTTDNFAGISQAFEHVHSLGHRKIGFAMANDIPEYRERYNAFGLMMAEKGLSVRQSWVYRGVNHVIEIGEWSSKILKAKDRPTAFLSTNDFAALGILRGAVNSGIRVPEQLSIVGFDDIEPSQLVTPALTTVRVPKNEIGRVSVKELMIALMNGKKSDEAPQCRVRLSPALVVRESTARAKGEKGR